MEPTVIDPQTPVIEATRIASEQGAHLIIDEFGRVLISPRVLPGQQRIYVFQRNARPAPVSRGCGHAWADVVAEEKREARLDAQQGPLAWAGAAEAEERQQRLEA